MDQIEKIKELLDSKDPVNCKIGLEMLSKIPRPEPIALAKSWANANITIFRTTPILIRQDKDSFTEMILGFDPNE